jgi:F0F1-type ATP synthase assembly protein I
MLISTFYFGVLIAQLPDQMNSTAPNGNIVDHHIGISKSFLTSAEKIISQ